MERVALDVERLHLGIADFDALLVGCGIERALDFQAGFGRRRSNQLDHGQTIDEWSPAPGLGNVAEQAVLDLIPLRRAGRIVMDVEHEPRLVSELLQLDFPQPDTRSIRAATIGRDRQLAGFRIALAPHRVEPAADGGDGELSRVACDPDAHPSCIGANVVHAIRHTGTIDSFFDIFVTLGGFEPMFLGFPLDNQGKPIEGEGVAGFVSTVVTPLPAGWVLLLSGLAGLGVLSQRKRSSAMYSKSMPEPAKG
jgi:hypothetical protein